MIQNSDKKQEMISLSDLIAKELLEKGCLVHRYISMTTNSVYMKIDAGVGKAIRISDHSGRDARGCRYNIRTDEPNLEEIINESGPSQYFFSADNIQILIKLILDEKERMLNKYGKSFYMTLMNKDLAANDKSHSFWKSAQLLSLRNILNEVKQA